MSEQVLEEYDVVVVGGGAAGLNGAMMLGRSRRSVLVVDAGAPRNAPASAVHGLLGHDGTPPADLLDRGRDEVRRYGGHVTSGEVRAARRCEGGGFAVVLAGGRQVGARRLLVTTGLVDELPDVPGLRERWGHEVIHCPYCHGWEVRGQAIAVLGTGPMSVHQATLFSQLSGAVTLVTHAAPSPDDGQAALLAARGVRTVQGEVVGVEVARDRVSGLRLRDGTVVRCTTVAVATRMVARTGFLADLGLRPVEHPSGMGVHLPADATGRTGVEGVWAAGNVVDLGAQVGAAAAAGAMAGAQINYDLVMDDAARASLTAAG